MSAIQNRLAILNDSLKKARLRFDGQRLAYLQASITDLVRKKLVTKRDAIRIITPQWQKSALHNWLKEPQFSSRCPECMLDITGPRVLIHYHMKVHDAKRTEVREGEDYSRPFRIHFPTFKEFN